MSRIYISSSWKNVEQQPLVKELRERGHQVYDFIHPNGEKEENVWISVCKAQGLSFFYDNNCLNGESFKKMLSHENAVKRFHNHFNAMRDADTCILLLPCNRSAHAEAGYMAGMGKRVFVMDTSKVATPELMYLMFDDYFYKFEDLFQALSVPIPGVCKVCGCTWENPCHHPEHGNCSWVEPNLCSHCASVKEGGLGIKDDPETVHCVNDLSNAFK